MVYSFPTPRTIVITAAPATDAELLAVLNQAPGKEPVAPQVGPMAKRVDGSTFWIAYAADAKARGFLQMVPMFLGNAQGVPPAVQGMMQAVGKIKGAGLAVQALAGGSGRVQLHIDCDEPTAAKSFKDGGDALKTMAINKLANDRAAPPSLRQDLHTLAFTTAGTVATASMTFSAQTLDGFNGKLPGMPGFGGPPGR